jgi:hypothetical protein
MESEAKRKRVLLIGALIGAILGAGTAYLLMIAPSGDQVEGEEPKPITAMDLMLLTGGAAALIRRLDDFRRRL